MHGDACRKRRDDALISQKICALNTRCKNMTQVAESAILFACNLKKLMIEEFGCDDLDQRIEEMDPEKRRAVFGATLPGDDGSAWDQKINHLVYAMENHRID